MSTGVHLWSIMWNLMMDDLLFKLDECGCKCVAYADDVIDG